MIIHLYNKGTIAVPLKHGSRFVQQHYSKHFGGFEETSTRERDRWLPFVKYIVLRDPVENLKSALHSEIMENEYLDSTDKVENLLFHHYYRPHYGNHFDIELSKSLYESGVDFKVIQLKHLSYFLVEQTGGRVKQNESSLWIPKRNTPLFMDRDTFWYEFCKRYPIQSLELVELALNDRIYYNKLIEERMYIVNNKTIVDTLL